MASPVTYPAKQRLDELLEYNQDSGSLTWRRNVSAKKAGQRAGCLLRSGHRVVRVDGRLLLAHRVIWIMMTGEQPPDVIDHINERPDDNRWANLRRSNKAGNALNRTAAERKNRSTGCRNVTYADGLAMPFIVQVVGPGGKFYEAFDNLLDAAACAFRERRAAIEMRHRG